MKLVTVIAWRNKLTLVSLLILSLLACNLDTALSTISTPTAAPTATPIPTPTPFPVINASSVVTNNLALIDAAGLDFAKRRVIEAYRRVTPFLNSSKRCYNTLISIG